MIFKNNSVHLAFDPQLVTSHFDVWNRYQTTRFWYGWIAFSQGYQIVLDNTGWKKLTFGLFYGTPFYSMSILCVFFTNVHCQKCLIQSTAALAFPLFASIFPGLQNDKKYYRNNVGPGKMTDFSDILPLLDLFSRLKGNILSCKSIIFRISSKNSLCPYFLIFIGFHFLRKIRLYSP